MPPRRPNPKLVKIHRTYSIEEAATVCGVHRNTVREWIKRGLPCLDQQRPTLVHGEHLASYVRQKSTQHKRPCQPGEIYCMRCREPRRAADQQAVYQPLTALQGNLIGLCPTCGCRMFRRVSFAKLTLAGGTLRISMPEALDHIGDSTQASENSDFKQDTANHDETQPA